MSPSAALGSEVFRCFVLLSIGVLLVGGAVIAVVRLGMSKDCTQAWSAYKGWLLMLPVIGTMLMAGRAVAIIFFATIALGAFMEYARATGLHRDLTMTLTAVAGIVLVGVSALQFNPARDAPGGFGLFMLAPLLVVTALVLVTTLRNRGQGELKAVALALFGFLYIGWMFGHVALLADARNAYGYLLYLLFAVELNDVAAFTFGKLIGRRPLCPNISPRKTIEGALAAVLISMLFPLLVRFALPDFSAVDCLIAGLIVGVGGQIGDLSISVVKRDIGIKDMGSLLRGHGGLLDRIDSLLFAAPLFFHFTRYAHGL